MALDASVEVRHVDVAALQKRLRDRKIVITLNDEAKAFNAEIERMWPTRPDPV